MNWCPLCRLYWSETFEIEPNCVAFYGTIHTASVALCKHCKPKGRACNCLVCRSEADRDECTNPNCNCHEGRHEV